MDEHENRNAESKIMRIMSAHDQKETHYVVFLVALFDSVVLNYGMGRLILSHNPAVVLEAEAKLRNDFLSYLQIYC